MPENKISAKEIIVRPIEKKFADKVIRRIHYSGKVVNNSQLNFGVFLNDKILGAMSYGPPTDKSKLIGLVKNTEWNGFFELNRMAFDDKLPKYSESRAIAISIRWMKKNAKHIKWIVSFADGCQCGHGTIYQASNFRLTQIKSNDRLLILPNGKVAHRLTFQDGGSVLSKEMNKTGLTSLNKYLNEYHKGWKPIEGYMLRYIYFIDKKAEQNFTGEFLPFSDIEKADAKMYKGIKI